MKLFESILDDILGVDSGKSVEKVREMSRNDVEYDTEMTVEFDKASDDVPVQGAALKRIAGRLEELLETNPYITEFSEIDYISHWPDFMPRPAGLHRIYYSRPRISGNYTVELRVSFTYSFRRPIQAIYFLGQIYNALDCEEWKNPKMTLVESKISDHPSEKINTELLNYISHHRRDKSNWPFEADSTQERLMQIANFLVPCVQAYTDIAYKFDALNYNNVAFTADVFTTTPYDINKKIIIPGYLYVQMEDALFSGHNIMSAGEFDYFYRNMIHQTKGHVSGGTVSKDTKRDYIVDDYVVKELDERPRKSEFISAHAYKNIYLHIYITLGSFYNDSDLYPFLFAVDFEGYILDEPYVEEFADNICNNLFGGKVRKSDFIRFVKEIFPENYEK